jgi:geranylgeranyl transferase type-2 subunit alpha
MLTIVLLMRALDPLTYQDKTEDYLKKLSKVDECRREYYNDLRKKFRLENAIEKYWKRGISDDVSELINQLI